ncbi:MAG: Kelch repeat-containing protein [Acidimicrobiales bacterium]
MSSGVASQEPGTPTTRTADAGGSWAMLPPAPIGPRVEHTAIWTGAEMIVWGGTTEEGRPGELGDGASYDPVRRRWRLLSPSPLRPRFGHMAVWDGKEMLVWGGSTQSLSEQDYSDGAAYDPSTDRWRTIAPLPHPIIARGTALWTGSTVMVYGEWHSSSPTANSSDSYEGFAASYDPSADHWATMADPPLGPLIFPALAWTGRELIVFGGYAETGAGAGSPSGPPGHIPGSVGAAYDPSAGRWRSLPEAPFVERFAQVVWTGKLVLAYGGARVVTGVEPQTGELTGGDYDPATDRWTPWPDAPANSIGLPTALWSGHQMFIYGIQTFNCRTHALRPPEALAFSPSTRTWAALPNSGLSPRSEASAVWTGTQMIVWGGYADDCGKLLGLDDGAIYQPATPSTR